ncbi:MAG TPA: SUMF1/EgtB/PvdO family nonheme iron enzyme [Kofleriaceae bacterium]|nr:SUMF1/EgtB/PvdO family nonheme iron enzyme [Kofleriaceae bacterium]
MCWVWVVSCTLGLTACGSRGPAVGDDDAAIDGDGGGDGSGDAAVMPFASCVGLPMTCGIGAADSCCDSPEVVGGTYYRSYDVAGAGSMSSPATVSSFHLDKYEVTVGRFRKFVEAGTGTQATPPPPGAGAHAHIGGSGWNPSWSARLVADKAALVAALKCNTTFQTWTDAPGANEVRPMNCLTWYEAAAFCAWDGGYLPTEAEWNYAATGGDRQSAYPWSTLTLDGSHASYLEGTDCRGDGMAGCGLTDLVTVGSKPAGDGRWGQSELAGNVAEWTLDSITLYTNPCSDCAHLTDAGDRVVRGGSFGQTAFNLRTGNRSSGAPMDRSHSVGVRCARVP